MLRANLNQYLVKFTERLGDKEVVSPDTAGKIRKFVRAEETSAYWKLFLIASTIMGALTVFGGISVIVTEYWYDFPTWLKGVMGLFPLAIAGYFYYIMLTKHGKSTVWIESSSLFLMLMFGVSMALSNATFELELMPDELLFTWIVATIPLFYVKRASGIAYVYLALAANYMSMGAVFNFSFSEPVDFGNNGIWFWVFILAFLPHYLLTLDRSKKVQELRFMFLTLVLASTVASALILSVDSNRVLWLVVWNVGVYLFAKRYMGDHFWFWRRVMIWLPQLVVIAVLVLMSNRFLMMSVFNYDSLFSMKDWTGGQWYYFVLLLVVMAGIYFNYFQFKENYENTNQLVVFAPGLIIFLMALNEFVDAWWVLSLVANLYLLCMVIVIMVDGSENNKFWQVSAGLFLFAVIVLIRFVDTDMGFFWKGLLFMGFGGVFFLMTMFLKEKVDHISRNQRRIKD